MGTLSKAYALIIGVGKDLPITVKDAKAIYNILADPAMAGYPPDNISLLTGRKATRKNILKAFDSLVERAGEDASILLFYSGHGGTYSDNSFLRKENWKPEEENQHYFHLCPYDYDPVNYETTWIKAEEIKQKISEIRSRRLIFFLDCCHAAGMIKGVASQLQAVKNDSLTQADGLAQHLDDGRGMSIISSCRENQLSYILDGDKNSLYTKCMIEVLKGENKKNFDDPYVRISEVVQYIFKKVPEGNPNQNPYANLQIYDDFVLSYIPENLRNEQKTSSSTIKIEEDPKTASKETVTKFKESDNANSAILFIHSFSGQGTDTFAGIPNFLIDESRMEGWDMFPLGYSENIVPELGKNVWASLSDIKRNADYLKTSLKHKFGKYKRIAIIAHSLGGLVAQQAILGLEKEELDKISHLLLFGTPSGGLADKTIEKLNRGNLRDLSENGTYIQSLRSDWSQRFAGGYPFHFKTIAAIRDRFVPISSSLEPFPKEYRAVVEGDHFGMVGVSGKDNDTYNLIVNALTGNKFHSQFTSAEEINLALGEYDAVLKKLLPQVETLDAKGLEQLVFALEGTDRGGEALEILQKNPLANNNSNLLGILGGRYKRRYLESFSAEDAKASFSYYEKGLSIAETKGDIQQIYYLAINLAFLSILHLEDHAAMGIFAQKALEAVGKDPFNSLWKLATQAEANLYLGNFEEAKKHYTAAAKMGGIREKISMYTNAYNAYSCLMHSNNPEEKFIKFLRVKFLS